MGELAARQADACERVCLRHLCRGLGIVPATCATIGRMTYPELKKRGYDEQMSLGSLAGSGTLGC